MGERFWLNDTQWAAIEPLLPYLGGKPRVDDRRVISGILHRYREGLRWRAIPAEYGPRTTLFKPLEPARAVAGAAGRALSLRRTARGRHGRQHRGPHAPLGDRRKRGEHGQAIGRSRSGRTTKMHALCDGEGRRYALMLTGGQVHEVIGRRALLASVPAMHQFIADKAYDANDLRDFPAAQGTEAVILPLPRPVHATIVRPERLPDAQPHRARILCKLKGLARHRHALRQDRAQLPRRHLPRRRHHTLAPMSPRPSVRDNGLVTQNFKTGVECAKLA